jgi:hypothetical protein
MEPSLQGATLKQNAWRDYGHGEFSTLSAQTQRKWAPRKADKVLHGGDIGEEVTAALS